MKRFLMLIWYVGKFESEVFDVKLVNKHNPNTRILKRVNLLFRK